MVTPGPGSQPSPALFFETVTAYQRTEALKAAIELDLFTAIGEGNQTVKALSERCGTSERGTRILCDYLTIIGFLAKDGDRYSLTPDSAMFLDRRSPAYLGGALEFLLSPMLTEGFKDLAAIIRKGGTVSGMQGVIAPEHPVWVKFARAMVPLIAVPAAELIADLIGAKSGQKWKVLDIAAGHGLFGIAIAKQNPNAEIIAQDWANVLEVAEENAQLAGISNRFRTIPGSALDVDYGSGYDIVLITNLLHHFDVPACEKLLRKVYAALKSGGRAVVLEFIPNEDRISPPLVAAFSMMMLGTTPGGDAYTFSELDRMFRNTGFSRTELHPLPPTIQQVVIGYKG